jgi:hypothetical protein
MSTRRTSFALVAAGLAGGLALGVTGFARAADPTPSPSQSPGKQLQDRHPGGRGGPFGGFRKEHRLRGAGGLVQAIDSDSLTVRGMQGTETIGLTSSTTYYVGRTKATRSAVEKGSVVHVRLVDPRATKKVAAVVMVVPAHLDGWVTKVSDDALTVRVSCWLDASRVVQLGSESACERAPTRRTGPTRLEAAEELLVAKLCTQLVGVLEQGIRAVQHRSGRFGMPRFHGGEIGTEEC